jgi:PST family polysaccharide transporter
MSKDPSASREPQVSSPQAEGGLSGTDFDGQRYFRTDHLLADLAGRTARGGAVTFLSQGIRFLLGIAVTTILARLLTPQDYGLIGMVAVFVGFASVLKDLGLSAATVQRAEITPDQISTLFWLNVVMSWALGLIVAASAPLVAWFYGEARLKGLTMALAGGFVLGGLAVQHESLMRRQMRFAALAAIEVVAMVAGASTAILWAWHGMGPWALVASQLTTALSTTVGLWVACGWRPGRPVRGSGVRPMLRFGFGLTGFGFVNFFSRNLDNLLIGRVWGSYQLGLYSRAYQLLLLPIDQINSPIAAVAIPALSRIVDAEERYRQMYLRILANLAIVTMAGTAFMIVTADWLIRIVLGPQWAEASRIFVPLGIIGLLQPVANTTGWLLITQGRTHHMFQIGLVGGGLTIVSFLVGLPWGAVGVAVSYAVTSTCLIPVLLWWVTRTGPVRASDIYSTMLPALVASLCGLVLVAIFRALTGPTSPLAGLTIAFFMFSLTVLTVLVVTPSTRRALRDFKPLLLLLAGRRGEAEAR